MERLNYTLVIISAKEVKSVCAGLWFDDKAGAERYAEGVTAGLALAGKKNCAVIMHLLDNPQGMKPGFISKNCTYKHAYIYTSVIMFGNSTEPPKPPQIPFQHRRTVKHISGGRKTDRNEINKQIR